MTREEKIEVIRKACIEVNPEIVELKFGCEVQVDFGDWEHGIILSDCVICPKHKKKVREDCYNDCDLQDAHWIMYGNEEDGFWDDATEDTKIKEVLGRPIRLADVLLAIGKAQIELIASVPTIYLEQACLRTDDAIRFWNLRTNDLSQQSDECINFLYSLLIPKRISVLVNHYSVVDISESDMRNLMQLLV